MHIAQHSAVITGFADLSNESRMIATPWSRMLRGIALGQYPCDYDPVISQQVLAAYDRMVSKVSASDGYTHFGRKLANFIVRVIDPNSELLDVDSAVKAVVRSVRAITNPYYRVMAGSILMDTVAKIGVDSSSLMGDAQAFATEMLGVLDTIAPDAIADENQGRHGEYERVFASSAVFLAIGQLGLRNLLVTPERNRVIEALDLLEKIPIPYFCGRAAGTLMSVLAVLGYADQILDGERDYMQEVLEYLTRADEIGNWPEFDNHITTPWKKVYPLLTMLNAIAMCGRPDYLTRPIDVLQVAADLMEQIPWEIRVHMAQYYLIALHNLGRLDDQIPDLRAYVREIVGVLDALDPGENYSPRGNAYPYVIEIAMMTGNLDLVPDSALERMVDSFIDLDSPTDRQNRPFPVSYVVNILVEIGAADLLFAPRPRYGELSALEWAIDNLSDGAEVEGDRVSMLNHALISAVLRMRGADAAQTELFEEFEFPFAASKKQ